MSAALRVPSAAGTGGSGSCVGELQRLHAAQPAQVQQAQVTGGEVGTDRDDRGEQAVTVEVPLVVAVLILPVEADDDVLAGGPGGRTVTYAVVGDGSAVKHALR